MSRALNPDARAGRPRRLAAAAAGLAALGSLGACSDPPPSPEVQAQAADHDNLVAAAVALGPEAAACVGQPPPGWNADGLNLLATQAPLWVDAMASFPPEAAAGGPCAAEDLARDLARVEALALRVAAATPRDPVPVAVGRAAGIAKAIGQDALTDLEAPDPADLDWLTGEALMNLAAAEDQAGFQGEYLAALQPAGELRTAFAAAAAAHRARGDALAAMADAPDLRAAAYALGEAPADETAARARFAAAELALANHYAELPLAGTGAEPTIRWQFAKAHWWGAELPALPLP